MLSGLVVVYGIIAIALGIEDIVVYVRLSRFTGFGPMLSLIAGILSVMCGIMLLANPNVGKWALTILMPIWFIAHCISGLTRVNLVRLIGNSFYYYNFGQYFEDIECYGNNEKSKGDNIRLVMERNGLEQTIYVGDIQGDYDATMQAGATFIHAKYGFGTINTEVAEIEKFSDLPEVAARVFQEMKA